MRLADVTPGGLYSAKDRAGGFPWRLVLVLSIEPWHRHWSEGHRPAGPEDRTGRVRDLPAVEFDPVLYLGDGTPRVLRWGWDVSLAGIPGAAGQRPLIRSTSMHVCARPVLVSLSHLHRAVPTSVGEGVTIVEAPER